MEPLNQQTYTYLKQLIIDSRLSYQEIYSETKVAKELGVSRTPLRDAMHRLAQEGYIDIIPSKGFRIHQLSQKDVTDTFQIRSALESYSTLKITRECNTPKAKSLFKELEKSIESMEEVMNTTKDIVEFSEHDFKFHHLIIDYIENEHFSSVFDSYLYRMKKLAWLSLSHEGRMEDTCREHRAILEGMRSGDSEHIYMITLNHMDRPKEINLSDIMN